MRCAWKQLLGILPIRLRKEIDQAGRDTLQELRLRINAPPELVLEGGRHWLHETTEKEDLDFVINAATSYSPWTAVTASQGYITAPGGHRIGICGDVIWKNGAMAGFQRIRSLCIRVARDFPGIGNGIGEMDTSFLILGAPGTGKTTLLRDLIRQIAERKHIAVVDERGELFPDGFRHGRLQDTLSGCRKSQGIEILLRTMGPEYIAVDEITAEEDSQALIRAACCGVGLAATAHAGTLEDYYSREIYRPLHEANIFRRILVLNRDKTFTWERVES